MPERLDKMEFNNNLNILKVRQTKGWKMLLNGNYGELVDQIVEAIIE
jgi:hypothetical protein